MRPELPEGTVSWRSLLDEATHRLSAASCPDPEISARRMVERASGFEGADFVLGLDEPATVRGVAHFDAMVTRRVGGEPLQYVVGSWGFRNLDLLVDKRVLIPRPETEVVAGKALSELERLPLGDQLLAVDLGTGSGAIGLSLVTEHKSVEVWMTDRSEEALAVARANLAGIGRPGSRVNVALGSWFEALGPDLRGAFSLVVSNPPYVATSESLPSSVADWEPTSALLAGADGLDDIHHLLVEAPGWLRPDGSMVLEIGTSQGGAVTALATEYFSEVELFHDLAGKPRGVVGRRPRSGAVR